MTHRWCTWISMKTPLIRTSAQVIRNCYKISGYLLKSSFHTTSCSQLQWQNISHSPLLLSGPVSGLSWRLCVYLLSKIKDIFQRKFLKWWKTHLEPVAPPTLQPHNLPGRVLQYGISAVQCLQNWFQGIWKGFQTQFTFLKQCFKNENYVSPDESIRNNRLF